MTAVKSALRGVPGIQYRQDGLVATITLSRPERLNALTFDIYDALGRGFRALRDDTSVRSVILTGEGRGFCSGGDVNDIIGKLVGMDRAGLTKFTRSTCDVIQAMRDAPQPIVAALNGLVGGAGAVIALAADFRLAVPEARIGFIFVKAGLSGADMGAAYLLPRYVGLGRASQLLMTGEWVPADEAQRIGLYNRIVEPAQLMKEATALASSLAAGPRDGLRVTKEALEAEATGTLRDALDHDVRVQTECMMHPDFREAYHAFVGKRPPRFG